MPKGCTPEASVFCIYKHMKKFITAKRDLKSMPNELNGKLVWNPIKQPWSKSQWLVTTVFSESIITKMGLEFIYKPNLIQK